MALVKYPLFGQPFKKRKKAESLLLACILAISPASCSPQQPAAASVVTSRPVNTKVAILQAPSSESQFIQIKDSGFSLDVQPDLEFDTHDSSISISDKSGRLKLGLNRTV